ncbi:PhzF family phenazine biosynthesis protein [Pontibacter sp. JH31]|uniref:PhzF family phenazine biosynthesis protein n=1 Tax=Pontibacter aquaedesilientis TaxID=2766980 RepID=A0ABR7XFA4_9BACT|nr:PhzF family phenazine biosynthesis protein [Pontibacter aquaedesilientis]MBD1396980.1 PhzF family phenazine biosynthesis protein [Pontibacter aquaedesilientis]
MKIKLYQIDAFTEQVFGGNPAAVCILDEWLSDTLMQQIAGENNLAETAFVVKSAENFEIRWFTPTVEVDLCGHATLAAAHVLFHYYNYPTNLINFYSTRSGLLRVTKGSDGLTLDFPTDTFEEVDTPEVLVRAFGKRPEKAFKGKTDYLLLYTAQQDIEAMQPDLGLVATVGGRGVIVSAPGIEVDFVSRFFAPQAGIDEDPVTGSAHTTLTPVWSEKLGKKVLSAQQLSKRRGSLKCEFLGDRVKITGKAVTYLVGEIEI